MDLSFALRAFAAWTVDISHIGVLGQNSEKLSRSKIKVKYRKNLTTSRGHRSTLFLPGLHPLLISGVSVVAPSDIIHSRGRETTTITMWSYPISQWKLQRLSQVNMKNLHTYWPPF